MRILHLPIDLGGHASGLARAQRGLGHEAVVGNLAWSPFGFNGDLDFARRPGDTLRLPRRELGRMALLLRSILSADVIHAHFGQTLASLRPFPLPAQGRSGLPETLTVALAQALWLRDIRLWRRLGKTVAMTFYGDDIRLVPAAIARNPFSHLAIPEVAAALAGRDAWKRRQMDALSAAGVTIFAANPDLLATLPAGARLMPYCHVESARLPASQARLSSQPLRFLHMPSDRLVKGTHHFVDAVARLQAKGLACSLTILEGRGNAEALAALAGHDVLLDQLHVGWYGGVALEAMAAGKPVVAHILDADLALVPAAMRDALPICKADPTNVADVLESLVRMPAPAFEAIGAAGRRFAAEWHDPASIARDVIAAYGASLP
jgi:hypothetical protein